MPSSDCPTTIEVRESSIFRSSARPALLPARMDEQLPPVTLICVALFGLRQMSLTTFCVWGLKMRPGHVFRGIRVNAEAIDA